MKACGPSTNDMDRVRTGEMKTKSYDENTLATGLKTKSTAVELSSTKMVIVTMDTGLTACHKVKDA